MPLEHFAAKSAAKLIKEIQAHKKIALARFLVALGIPQVGTVTAGDLSREFKTLTNISQAPAEKLQTVAGIGKKVSQEINNFFQDHHTQTLIKKYRAVGIAVESSPVTGPLQGLTFVFTGSLPNLTRDEAKQLVQAQGGKVGSVAGDKVDYVVVGAAAGTKAEKARELGLKILTPAQFKKMLKEL